MRILSVKTSHFVRTPRPPQQMDGGSAGQRIGSLEKEPGIGTWARERSFLLFPLREIREHFLRLHFRHNFLFAFLERPPKKGTISKLRMVQNHHRSGKFKQLERGKGFFTL